MSQGEKVTATLTCKPNAENHRDLDISIDYHFDGQHCKSHNIHEYRLR